MRKIIFKSILFYGFTLFSLFLTAQTAPDEDTGAYTTCNPDGENATRTSNDLPNPVNVGTIDDRSCYANYKESIVYGKTWGVYNITDGSNKFDTTLQPRIERSLSRSRETGVGSFARFTGTFRILEVGDTAGTGSDGTYIAQAKGKHTGGGGSPDPAICLYLAKPVYGSGANASNQVSFDIYAERILVRGGEGSGREIVFLKNVAKDAEIDFELEVGFREDPNDVTKKIHYCDAVIGGDVFNWNIPEPERGTESGIRYGAYRVKGGRAQIRWTNTIYQKAQVIDGGGSNPADEIYRLRNVATGKFLTAVGSSGTPVTMTDSGEPQNTHWTFVESGSFININNEANGIGILRAPGSGGPGGPYVVLSTGFESSTDADKSWTIHYDELEDTYRFESNSSRFLYHETNGSVTHASVPETDTRSVWQAIPTSVTLSTLENEFLTSSLRVYPNPAKENFTIALNDKTNSNIKIYNLLGKEVYQTTSTNGFVEVENQGRLMNGVYLIKVVTEENKVHYSKLVIK
ncbi:T9SS type A sorting domain-containing protein [Litoribaculum gwangyangense]|uniref:Secretion system C-terminal sorting domain-containing protein n=1 Tax=Litoribaculum gwangyangense TaxID=1130722 RepID=A0ABP9CRQ1_9FLAO